MNLENVIRTLIIFLIVSAVLLLLFPVSKPIELSFEPQQPYNSDDVISFTDSCAIFTTSGTGTLRLYANDGDEVTIYTNTNDELRIGSNATQGLSEFNLLEIDEK